MTEETLIVMLMSLYDRVIHASFYITVVLVFAA